MFYVLERAVILHYTNLKGERSVFFTVVNLSNIEMNEYTYLEGLNQK